MDIALFLDLIDALGLDPSGSRAFSLPLPSMGVT